MNFNGHPASVNFCACVLNNRYPNNECQNELIGDTAKHKLRVFR